MLRHLLDSTSVLNIELGGSFASAHICKFLFEQSLKICALKHVVLDKFSRVRVNGVPGSSLQKHASREKAPDFLCSCSHMP